MVIGDYTDILSRAAEEYAEHVNEVLNSIDFILGHMTNEELAEYLGMSKPSFWKRKNGLVPFTLYDVYKIGHLNQELKKLSNEPK